MDKDLHQRAYHVSESYFLPFVPSRWCTGHEAGRAAFQNVWLFLIPRSFVAWDHPVPSGPVERQYGLAFLQASLDMLRWPPELYQPPCQSVEIDIISRHKSGIISPPLRPILCATSKNFLDDNKVRIRTHQADVALLSFHVLKFCRNPYISIVQCTSLPIVWKKCYIYSVQMIGNIRKLKLYKKNDRFQVIKRKSSVLP